jgi:tetratricopeptide (TPR) repeat protein
MTPKIIGLLATASLVAPGLVASFAASSAHAQTQAAQPAVQTPLPLTGPAYALAQDAYKAYADGDYAAAADKAREALRQRPDVDRLRALLARAEAAQARQVKRPAVTAGAHKATRPAQRTVEARDSSATPSSPAPPAVSAAAPVALPPSPPAAPPPPPAFSPAYLAAEAAYTAFAQGDYDAAVVLARDAVQLEPGNADYRSLLANAQLESAYLAVRAGRDAQALEIFNRADAEGQLANTAWMDAAYAALRAGNDAQAISYFKRSIDDVGGLKLKMSPQMLFNTRRAVAEVSRETGVIASLSYRGAVPGVGLVPGAGGNTAQVGAEAYWRPWGYRNGRYVELFARAFETLYSQGGGATGSGTVQSALGIRYKPLTDTNAVVSFSRVFAARGGQDDWLAQLGYSGGSGGDLRVDVPAWWTTRISAEVGHYLESGRNYGLADLQTGRSFRIGDESSRWVLFPHLSLAADYDSTAVDTTSAGVGPGLGARYWFNEDTYNAPRSYLDLTLQYRVRLSGAKRAQGVFFNTTLSY